MIKQGLFGVIGAFLSCSLAVASHMAIPNEFHPVVLLQGGYLSLNGKTQHFMGTDSDTFTYTNSSNGRNAGFGGIFLGVEYPSPWTSCPGFFMQTGVEYNYIGNINIKGINTVGIEPQTSTTYHYNYDFKTQQVLGTLRVYATPYERFHVYGEVGLGAAFNHAGQYNATTTEIGSINLTPTFANQNQTQFSYSLGLGVDAEVSANIRVGLGYRYSNFGSSSLGKGVVTFNQYQSPVAFSLGSSNTYANQLIAHISYLI